MHKTFDQPLNFAHKIIPFKRKKIEHRLVGTNSNSDTIQFLMKKQVVFIHGATAFSKYEEFIHWLKTVPVVDLAKVEKKRWSSSLGETLGDAYELIAPTMPNKQNAKYEEWKIWFERHLEFMQDGVVLVGWSQGGYFLTKYLSENKMPVAVKALFLVATPFEAEDYGYEDGGDFSFDPKDLPNLEKQVEKIYALHSKDDPVVPYTHAEKFKKALPEAELVTFDGRGHFLTEEFPEIIDLIKNLQK